MVLGEEACEGGYFNHRFCKLGNFWHTEGAVLGNAFLGSGAEASRGGTGQVLFGGDESGRAPGGVAPGKTRDASADLFN